MARIDGYDILATTNRGRFSSEVLINLGHAARRENPCGLPLYIHPDDWFRAYLDVAGIAEEQAPEPARLGFRNRQQILVDYCWDRVIDRVVEGPNPRLALTVHLWWDEDQNPAPQFSFVDTAASPVLKVTSSRSITYRLLDYGGMMVIDEMQGITGRPVSGLLGAVFDVIGEGSLKHSRIAVSADGLQIVRVRSQKLIRVSVTATIAPDGCATKGIPEGRSDLSAIEKRMKMPLKIEYRPAG